MQFLELTLATPAENLALDEALLTESAAGQLQDDVLRIWLPTGYFVVLGRGSKIAEESQREYCRQRRIPILRRTSGGAAIVTGPGCLMYSLILNCERHPLTRTIDQTHRYVLNRISACLRTLGKAAQCAGVSDLVVRVPGDVARLLKVSGNSMRRGRTHTLYHGTLLLDFDLAQLENCLRTPPRMPTYRENRSHQEFVGNLHLPAAATATALRHGWDAKDRLESWPQEIVEQLVRAKYTQDVWNARC